LAQPTLVRLQTFPELWSDDQPSAFGFGQTNTYTCSLLDA
jgi:hypothetical protein